MTEPVSPASTNDAVALARAEKEAERSRTRRRTAYVVVALVALVVIGFCGTGSAVVQQRRHEHELWVTFVSYQAEYDCCRAGALGDEPAPCGEGVAALVELFQRQAQGPSRPARLAAWIEETTGLDPTVYSPTAPAHPEIDALVKGCAAARKLAGIALDGTDPAIVATAGTTLQQSDEHVALVKQALASGRYDAAFAGMRALAQATSSCRMNAASAALTPTSGGALPPGAESYLHMYVLCLRRLQPLVEDARAAARTHEAAFRETALRGAPELKDGAGYALALLGLDDAERTRAALRALIDAASWGNVQSAPFLEEQLGRALSNVEVARQFLAEQHGNLRSRLRLQRAFTRNAALRDDACRDLARVAIDPAVRGGAGDILAHAALDVAPVCSAALPIVVEGLQSTVQGGSYFAAEALGRLGVSPLPPLPRGTEGAINMWSPNAHQQAATRRHAAERGVSELVLASEDAIKGVDVGEPLLIDLFR